MADQENGNGAQSDSKKEFKPAPWEKEEIEMDDKKNVSFVSGLALLLSVLALILIGWSGIADSPIQAEYKDFIESKIESNNQRIDVMEETLEKQAKGIGKEQLAWQIYKLKQLEAAIGELTLAVGDTNMAEYNAIQTQMQALQAKLVKLKKTAVVEVPAVVPAPAPTPETPAK